jgi:UDP-N-acetylglucosamine 4,6-dehydratase
VRYGNVVGSRGSVVPFFRKQIDNGCDHLPITDAGMTRFWITLQQGVDFVLKDFARMHGGEIFVPKIPSVRVVDLARAMAPNLPQKIIGIRPGEKMHEVMCPADDAHLTLEFDDHYVIRPTIQFSSIVDFTTNRLGEAGKRVEAGFEFQSGKNSRYLSIEEIIAMNDIAQLK